MRKEPGNHLISINFLVHTAIQTNKSVDAKVMYIVMWMPR